MSSDPGAADRLNDALDALVTGAARARDLDPSLAATIADVFAADDAPAPPPGLADRVWQDLMGRTAAAAFVPLVPAARSDHNGHPPIDPRFAKMPNPHVAPRRSPSALSLLATAALLALALLGSFVALRRTLLVTGPEPRAISLPGRDLTPEGARPLVAGADGVLLRSRLDQLPTQGGPPHLALYRLQLAPGAVEAVGSQADTGVGANQFTVEAGQVTVEADGPVLVTRAGANPAAPRRVAPGTAIVLAVGDQLTAAIGVAFRRRNDGPAPATLLGVAIGAGADSLGTGALPPGVAYVRGLPAKRLTIIPAAPIETTVQRRTLAPGDELAVRDVPGLALVYVEAGALDLVAAKAETQATPPRAVTLSAGSGTGDFGPMPDRAVLANRGAEPLVILTAAMVSTSAGTPTPPAPPANGWGSGDGLPAAAP